MSHQICKHIISYKWTWFIYWTPVNLKPNKAAERVPVTWTLVTPPFKDSIVTVNCKFWSWAAKETLEAALLKENIALACGDSTSTTWVLLCSPFHHHQQHHHHLYPEGLANRDLVTLGLTSSHVHPDSALDRGRVLLSVMGHNNSNENNSKPSLSLRC